MTNDYLKDLFIDEVKGCLAGGSGTGPAGADGEDGVSPTISITDIEGGHRVTITDVNGPQTFDVMDGVDGADGEDGAQGPKGDTGDTGPQGPKGDTGDTGPQGAAGTTPVKGTDYWTETDKQEIVADVLAELNTTEEPTEEPTEP